MPSRVPFQTSGVASNQVDGSDDCGGAVARDRRRARALAAAAAFGIALGEDGEALRTDGDSGGARVSPLWRQRFFVQV